MTASARLIEIRNAVLTVEEPLADAHRFVHALRLIGHGLMADHDDAGDTINAVAWAASEKIDAVKRGWERVLRAARKGK
jgi:hypothetical protein